MRSITGKFVGGGWFSNEPTDFQGPDEFLPPEGVQIFDESPFDETSYMTRSFLVFF